MPAADTGWRAAPASAARAPNCRQTLLPTPIRSWDARQREQQHQAAGRERRDALPVVALREGDRRLAALAPYPPTWRLLSALFERKGAKTYVQSRCLSRDMRDCWFRGSGLPGLCEDVPRAPALSAPSRTYPPFSVICCTASINEMFPNLQSGCTSKKIPNLLPRKSFPIKTWQLTEAPPLRAVTPPAAVVLTPGPLRQPRPSRPSLRRVGEGPPRVAAERAHRTGSRCGVGRHPRRSRSPSPNIFPSRQLALP